MNMVLPPHCCHYQRHSVENCVRASFNLRTHASKITRCGRVNSSGRAHSIKMFKCKSKHCICRERTIQRLPHRLSKIITHTHEADQVRQIQGLFLFFLFFFYYQHFIEWVYRQRVFSTKNCCDFSRNCESMSY